MNFSIIKILTLHLAFRPKKVQKRMIRSQKIVKIEMNVVDAVQVIQVLGADRVIETIDPRTDIVVGMTIELLEVMIGHMIIDVDAVTNGIEIDLKIAAMDSIHWLLH